ncbi:hypothetical protein OKW96_20320 [Sphingobacterium sp. KU25419]|nr:hypothetical protein OKW96_20320 [Sphingobacterium sp. KU25419]
MKIFGKKHSKEPPVRYSENYQGDFYVENDICMRCGAPEFEAPDFIDHSKAEYGHCYFKNSQKLQMNWKERYVPCRFHVLRVFGTAVRMRKY